MPKNALNNKFLLFHISYGPEFGSGLTVLLRLRVSHVSTARMSEGLQKLKDLNEDEESISKMVNL